MANTAPTLADITVADGLFDPEALLELREFALQERSTKNFDGYRLISLKKVIQEDTFTQILRVAKTLVPPNAIFRTGWLLVHDTEGSGTPVHCDVGFYTVNIWLTPDAYIQGLERNGAVLYNQIAPYEWSMLKANSDTAAIQAILDAEEPEQRVVHYAFNRALVFPSRLIHRTSGVFVLDGQEHRRVNLTLTFEMLEDELG